jgi:mono/diheme cytochrome c family protein
MRIPTSFRIASGLALIAGLAVLAQQKTPAPPSVAAKPEATATPVPKSTPSAPAVADASKEQAMIDQYCIMCHSTAAKTAGVVLEGSDIAHLGKDTDLWEKVLRKFSTGQMPPPGMPHPDAETASQFISFLSNQLDANAAAHPNPGAPSIHRLNRFEYGNTVRDLLGLEIDVNSMLPGDDSGYGFDNNGDVLSVSPVLLEKYVAAARSISRLAVGEMNTPGGETEYLVPYGASQNDRASDDQPLGSRAGYSVVYNFPLDAEYIIRVTMNDGGDRGAKVDTRLPLKAGRRIISVATGKTSPLPENTAPPATRGGGGGFAAGLGGPPPVWDLRIDDARVKLFDTPEQGAGKGGQGVNPGGGGVFSMSVLGPYNPTGAGDTPSRRKIFVCTPAAPSEEQACATKILTNLALHAYRRPVTSADISPLMGFYQQARQNGSFDNGIELALRAVLSSPEFLFREEQNPVGAKADSIYRIGDYELASRLSYFLWSSMPDDTLLDLAKQGRLHEPAVLDEQMKRMLADKKSKAFVTNFAGQWLYLRNVESDRKDADVFPDYDQSLRDSFKTETEMLFASVVDNNGSLLDLLRAKYTFLNERLAKHYGIPGVYGPAFRKVVLTDPNRFGLLGQGSLLTVTSYPNRTSVVARGKWILENLVGAPPPPPPPDVPALKPHGSSGSKTLRQAMEEHRADPNCAVCHTRMDPLGFALENFSAVGKWRVLDDTAALIDPKSALADGTVVDGPQGLSNLLMTKWKNDFVDTFTEKLMTYALGRGVESYDLPAVRAITRATAPNDYRISSLISGVVHSSEFQMRRTPSE